MLGFRECVVEDVGREGGMWDGLWELRRVDCVLMRIAVLILCDHYACLSLSLLFLKVVWTHRLRRCVCPSVEPVA